MPKKFIEEFLGLCDTIANVRKYEGKAPLNCVVIEDGWLCYEDAWDLVEREKSKLMKLYLCMRAENENSLHRV